MPRAVRVYTFTGPGGCLPSRSAGRRFRYIPSASLLDVIRRDSNYHLQGFLAVSPPARLIDHFGDFGPADRLSTRSVIFDRELDAFDGR